MAESRTESRPNTALCSVEEFVSQSYDYVIVGGGTSGLVVAARLTENPDVRVGVIEAGPNLMDDPMIMTPNAFSLIIGREAYDWMMMSVPQAGANNKLFAQPRGKCLGGSSAINYLMYVRGSKNDYNEWAKFGGDGWDWEGLLPYFRKHQKLDLPPIAHKDPTFRPHALAAQVQGSDGPIHTSFNEEVFEYEEAFVKVTDKISGRPKTLIDAYGGDHIGVYSSLAAIDRSDKPGTRSYAATGYLQPNLGRPNLKVLTEAYATKILLNGTEAQGVAFTHGGKSYEIKAVKEVVLATGVFKTPQLLELSGIGDPDVLKKVGIDCVVDNKMVGANLQDHIISGASYDLKDGYLSFDALNEMDFLQEQQDLFLSTGKGMFSNPFMLMGFKSYESIVSKEELQQTLNELENDSTAQTSFGKAQQQIISKQLADPTFATIQCFCCPALADWSASHSQPEFFAKNAPGVYAISSAIGLEHPLSRGTVHIASADPFQQPTIDPQYLSNPLDLKLLMAGMRYLLKVSEHPDFAKFLKRRHDPPEDMDLNDEETLKEYVKSHCNTQYHPLGTAAMGEVVNERLLVKGTRKLRIVDASVFPTHISGNIMATVYAVAEKAADMIKEDDGRF
ncbi:aryl-alcohol dehydrogenase [Rhizodiscina lignyota]|uniref:Aryl-alcohol dehydrogenase n=1 Tax=Rhizodiscina lignyota TaxID=1504668 RepID=A0A9P4IB60_9PEZI|nr:aryl-alcohol dehydrogenase [Rhizodiscina lignyota]